MVEWTEQAIDEWAVDQMAERMKAKLAKKREDGRNGWYRDEPHCSEGALMVMIEDHVERGNWLDVANLAMFLELRGGELPWLEALHK